MSVRRGSTVIDMIKVSNCTICSIAKAGVALTDSMFILHARDMCDPYVVTRHNYGRDTLRSKRPMSCLEAGHILPNGLEKTIFIFLLSQHLDQI